ncbi:MAG: response regulator [Planctomycetota bacterium]|jgi:CheY-like chemotaxis protein
MKRILVVDDEEDVRRVACAFLEDAGYQTAEASNGEEALAMMERDPCDLVLTDLVMPDKEGAETVMDLRKRWKEVGIVAMSGVIGAEFYLRAAKMLGADGTLLKPFTREELVEMVEAVLVS